MPKFRRLSPDEIAAMRSYRRGTVDLTEYSVFLRDLGVGEGGEVVLDANEIKRTVKRRLTRAAHLLGKDVRYRRTEGNVVRFEVRPGSSD
ncbi:MAG: hypothetical protein HY534_04290 [Chloroflexi bacterium]|nr:hypothetical protein [Chloroflexota bacterium]